jgi:hypothetical protein
MEYGLGCTHWERGRYFPKISTHLMNLHKNVSKVTSSCFLSHHFDIFLLFTTFEVLTVLNYNLMHTKSCPM